MDEGTDVNPILKVITAAVALTLATALPARATSIAIANSSFESPSTPGATYGTVDDWVLAGPSTGGVWDISNNLGGCPGPCWIPTSAPDGSQIGWLSIGGGGSGPASMTQVLSDSLVANSTYTLTGVYGHPHNFAAGTVFTAELFAGSTLLASFSGTGPDANFTPFSLSYYSGSSPAAGLLTIVLSSNQAQTGFDRIALSYTVPDGGFTASLLGVAMIGLGLLRRALA